MMDFRKISDDFFTIGNIAILKKDTGNDVYDMVAKSIGDDTNYKQLLILPFDN